MRPLTSPSIVSRRAGFTVLELMLAVSIMTVIVIGLYTVFDQTQRALRSTMRQVDLLEGVRATRDLVSSEIAGASYLPLANYTNLFVARNPRSIGVSIKGLVGETVLDTVIQDLFFHTRVGNQWSAVGFWVGPMFTNINGTFSVGRLYRFGTDITEAKIREMGGHPAASEPDKRNDLLTTFNGPNRLAYSAPVLDGVVHFRLVAFSTTYAPLFPIRVVDARGEQRFTYLDRLREEFSELRQMLPKEAYLGAQLENTDPIGVSVRYQFSDVSYPPGPGEVELELGILEPQVVRQYESIAEAPPDSDPDAAAGFLSRHAGQIHLFRQRIPLRNAPYSR